MFLLDGTEADPGVDHHSIEVAVTPRDTLHRTRTPHEGLSCGRRPGGHLGTGGHRVGGEVGGKVGGEVGGEVLCKVLLDVDWSRCGLAGVGLWSGITRDRT